MDYFYPMKNIFLLAVLVVSCASQKSATYHEDKIPAYEQSKDFSQKPDVLLPAAKKVLDSLISASDPKADDQTVQQENNTLKTGWIYATSKDKYLVYKFNGMPKRIPLKVRRQINLELSPSIAGSLAKIFIKEEIENLDKTTGQFKSWDGVKTDNAAYQDILSQLTLEARKL